LFLSISMEMRTWNKVEMDHFWSQYKMATCVAILGRGEFCKVVGEGLFTRFSPGTYIITDIRYNIHMSRKNLYIFFTTVL